ncbi:MAG: hypothetical protein MJ244_05540 [Clostridia bacterium]|nr:hypothetical protein [Clostridia bacterium]
MAKTQEELDELKNELESLTFKFRELTDDELNIVTGGGLPATGAIARMIGPNGAGKTTIFRYIDLVNDAVCGIRPEETSSVIK